jgi:hypothetical protein
MNFSITESSENSNIFALLEELGSWQCFKLLISSIATQYFKVNWNTGSIAISQFRTELWVWRILVSSIESYKLLYEILLLTKNVDALFKVYLLIRFIGLNSDTCPRTTAESVFFKSGAKLHMSGCPLYHHTNSRAECIPLRS